MKTSNMHDYEIILVSSFFRRNCSYLSIIKYLISEYRIGLFVLPLEKRFKAKHRTTHKIFIEKCIKLGATLLDEEPVSCKILVIPQEAYSEDNVRKIKATIQAEIKFGSLTLAWPGLHDRFLDQFQIQKVFIVNKSFFKYLIKERCAEPCYRNIELIEVGLPFLKYPVIEEFYADYILAIPTPFSFPRETDKWHFLETVITLFGKMSKGDIVVHKPHNASDKDYFVLPLFQKAAFIVAMIPEKYRKKIFLMLSIKLPFKISSFLSQLYTAYLYKRVLSRTLSMEAMTKYHQFAVEVFYPRVRKGIIGGLSNTIWGARFFNIPYYNCVDISLQEREKGHTLYKKDPSNLLDLNLKFFNIPYCSGDLMHDRSDFDFVDQSSRDADFICELKKMIN